MEQAKKTKVKHVRTWVDWALLGTVVACTLMVVIALCTQLRATPAEKMQKELERLADDYYITYLYPRLLGNLNADPAKMLAGYHEVGVGTTYLRQLLHYNNDENIASAQIFRDLGCDTNRTSVRYFPIEPYGPRDYTVYYHFDCRDFTE